jgi:hypothetical protein
MSGIELRRRMLKVRGKLTELCRSDVIAEAMGRSDVLTGHAMRVRSTFKGCLYNL